MSLHEAARYGNVAELEALLAGLSLEEAKRKIEERDKSDDVSFFFFVFVFSFFFLVFPYILQFRCVRS